MLVPNNHSHHILPITLLTKLHRIPTRSQDPNPGHTPHTARIATDPTPGPLATKLLVADLAEITVMVVGLGLGFLAQDGMGLLYLGFVAWRELVPA